MGGLLYSKPFYEPGAKDHGTFGKVNKVRINGLVAGILRATPVKKAHPLSPKAFTMFSGFHRGAFKRRWGKMNKKLEKRSDGKNVLTKI